MNRLRTRQIRSDDELQRFFDEAAPDYRDQHGHSENLLRHRLSVIGPLIGGISTGTLLEIGCGTGIHLFTLAGQFDRVIGTDISPKMIERARAVVADCENPYKFTLAVDRAERLSTVSDGAVDVVLCVGAFEHMTGQAAVLAQVRRVLKSRGCFVCLTPNGEYLWYRFIAEFLGIDTRHLSTDRFVTLPVVGEMLSAAGLEISDSGYWTFIPKGDTGPVIASLLSLMDWAGRCTGLSGFRGGLYVKAIKPQESGF